MYLKVLSDCVKNKIVNAFSKFLEHRASREWKVEIESETRKRYSLEGVLASAADPLIFKKNLG